ncbi:MAG: hypothetical protein NTW28_22935, partial [Candidatus Solibacter sp.]|nr:hypothetical protein [Candidatus Solibacter sp.]
MCDAGRSSRNWNSGSALPYSTKKFTVFVDLIGVTTVTVLPVGLAPAAIVKLTVIVVEFTTTMPLTVTPVPDTVT